ncbi:Apc15p protein-domain-containing protein [Halenospora varia]|nr:Apc15p protein-domain-containing protein [Halenospora varia]
MWSLPSLAPQDSYTLWYTSSNSTNASQFDENTSSDHPPVPNQGQNAGPHPQRRHHTLHRHPLSRLRQDEQYIERRKQNVQNYGNSWIKPPGIPKTLHQQREEKREMEEHQEALRREALAQELAEAEAAEGADPMLQGEGMDPQMEEARDLDDDVPEAETTNLTVDDDDDDSESNDDLGDEIEEVPRGVLASRMPDDVYREALVRGEDSRSTRFAEDGNSTVDEDHSQMLQEEDLVHDTRNHDPGDEMDMDADLDADIPEAGGYEHTDSDAELSSSEEDDSSVDGGSLPRGFQPATSMVRSDGTQNSMDISGMLSNGSSQMGSSPQLRQHRGGLGGFSRGHRNS